MVLFTCNVGILKAEFWNGVHSVSGRDSSSSCAVNETYEQSEILFSNFKT